MARKYKLFLVAFVASVGLDQLTKLWARHSLRPRFPSAVEVIPGFFDLRYSENPGAAFGLLRDVPWARWVFFAVGIAAGFLVWTYLKKAKPHEGRLGAELGLLAGGALGNIIDRVLFSRVTDFIVWKVKSHEWPTFNIADAALVIGIIGLMFDYKPPDAEQKKGANKKKG
jgi:signal peptidase II